jgi:hypothetical protein
MSQGVATHRQHGPEVRGALPRARQDASARWRRNLAVRRPAADREHDVAPAPPASNALAQFRAAFSTTPAVGSSPSAPVPSVLRPPVEQNISTLHEPDVLTVQRCQSPTCVESTSTYVYTASLPRMIFGQSGRERRGAGASSLCSLKMRPPTGTASCLRSTALRAGRGGPETTENQRGGGGGWKDH